MGGARCQNFQERENLTEKVKKHNKNNKNNKNKEKKEELEVLAVVPHTLLKKYKCGGGKLSKFSGMRKFDKKR